MTSLSVVVPCFNEAEGIPQLSDMLMPVVMKLRLRYSVEILFIDDGSTDDTYQVLQNCFGGDPCASVIKHLQNQNIGGSIQTGIACSSGDWIANLDSDCTYDPQILDKLLIEIERGADIATASPYHPRGQVLGVPLYRLFLSKGLTAIYRAILRKRIYTVTAMVRIYRRSVFKNIAPSRLDFTCVAEMMLKALCQDLRVAEVPAVLSVRRFGQSKMKTGRIILAHFKLIARLIFNRKSFLA